MLVTFLLKNLNGDFLGLDCLLASLFEQLGGSKNVGALGFVLSYNLRNAIVKLIVVPE